MSQPKISRHLALLRHCGLLLDSREGQWVFYQINPKLPAWAFPLLEKVNRPLWQNSLFFFVMVAILVFVNWGKPLETSGIWYALYAGKWWITGLFGLIFAVLLVLWFNLKLVLSELGVCQTDFALIIDRRFNCRLPARPSQSRSLNSVRVDYTTGGR